MLDLRITGRAVSSRAILLQDERRLSLGDEFEVDVPELRGRGLITVLFEAHFAPGVVVQASATVVGLEGVRCQHTYEKRLDAMVLHEEEETTPQVAYMKPAGNQQKDCRLHCPATGKRSAGPCIDCSDGEYTIQLCCKV